MDDQLKLSPLPTSEWDQSLCAILEQMQGRPLNVHSLMANHPELLSAWWNFRNYSISGGALGRRKGELVILRVAVQVKAWYEWASHVERSLACGLSLEEIERVQLDPSSQDWHDSEAILLKAVDELIANHVLSLQTHSQLREHYSVKQIMDIMAIHGMYLILGCMINTWGLELDPRVQEKLPATVTQEKFEGR